MPGSVEPDTADLTIEFGDVIHRMEAAKGSRLLDLLSMVPEIEMSAPCGGNGTCGKCRIRIIPGPGKTGLSPPGETEKTILSQEELNSNIRLACCSTVTGNCHVVIPKSMEEARIAGVAEDHGSIPMETEPPVVKSFLSLEKPSLNDQRPDDERLLEALSRLQPAEGTSPSGTPPLLDLAGRRSLPSVVRQNDFQVTVIHSRNRIYRIEAGDSSSRSFGIAMDIGTTTVVAYLVDLLTRRVVDTLAGLNHQGIFGSDVISRIEFCMRTAGGLYRLREKIIRQAEHMITELVEKNGMEPGDITALTAAGNTVMMHFLTGLDPAAIAAAPFIPAGLGPEEFPAEELGFRTIRCPVMILPSISGYVGADISAGIAACGMMDEAEPALLVDIGTNGEIVLGSREGFFACSTAAGPAFEGAHISHGMGGVAGAVNTVKLVNGTIIYTTLGGGKARGICGSGIVDTAAALVGSGTAEYTGRIADTGKNDRFTVENGEPAFVIVPPEECEEGEALLFTQKDLREVQLAKAAVAAGIATLVHEAGIEYGDIHRVMLAGGFGSFIDPGSAVHIGLFPRDLSGRIESVGNSAGRGAVKALLSRQEKDRLSGIREMTRAIELSAHPFFQEAYIENMYFPMVE